MEKPAGESHRFYVRDYTDQIHANHCANHPVIRQWYCQYLCPQTKLPPKFSQDRHTIMANLIEHFMWGYQQYSRIFTNVSADSLFAHMDYRLQPEVFLVGVLDDANSTDRFPSCVEPEANFWIHADDFTHIRELATDLVTKYPEYGLSHTHPVAQQRENRRLELRSIREAIQRTIEAHPECPENRRFYISWPEQINRYLVCTVLSIREDVASSYPSLNGDSIQLHEYRHFTVPASLLDAVAEQFLQYALREFCKPMPSAPGSIDYEELTRAAGSALTAGIACRVGEEGLSSGTDLFRNCSNISSLRYERVNSSGRIVIAARNHSSIIQDVSFKSPVAIKNWRTARKLLEMTSQSTALHTDATEIFGLVGIDAYNGTAEDLYEVQVVDQHHWELLHHGRVLMTVKFGIPELPKPRFDDEAFRSHAKRTFKGIATPKTNLLLSLVKQAEQESRGTLLLISTTAAREAERLASQGIPITPRVLTPETLKHLTPIDGAIMLDPEGTCYAIGTILDGDATPNGDSGRGARYNSAVRYVESIASKAHCLAVVVSEDGDVDFVPKLGPPPLII